jgi:hypothetical protein
LSFSQIIIRNINKISLIIFKKSRSGPNGTKRCGQSA